MSNQPKIVYRSDTTGCTYHMMQHVGEFSIQVLNMDDVVVAESQRYHYLTRWRSTINLFFDVITIHINTGKWEG